MSRLEHVCTPVLDIAYEDAGPEAGTVVVLMHGFPYDPRAFDEVAAILHAEGFRTIVPYVRGYGDTRFISPDTMRSGQQAAVGQDLLDLLDALQLQDALLAGFDWGARAACIVAALWPERVRGLVSCGGYQIQDIAAAPTPTDPQSERRWWYQYYFHTERGRNGLARNRNELCRLLWALWSPTWRFGDEVFERTASSFANPDFVDVAIHSYRHRHGNAAGDPRYADAEARLATLPEIGVPTIALHGAVDDVTPLRDPDAHQSHFAGPYACRVLEGVGHNVPQEAPKAFAQAILDLDAGRIGAPGSRR